MILLAQPLPKRGLNYVNTKQKQINKYHRGNPGGCNLAGQVSGWLMWHPESECLFMEHDPECMESHYNQGCEDLTGDIIMQQRYDVEQEQDRKRAERRATAETARGKEVLLRFKVFQNMVDQQIFPSCINCLWFDRREEVCDIYKVRPPARTIVFSCGESWVADIPF